jgi:NhaP-type Na+/H+ or K+/H+ antiporter
VTAAICTLVFQWLVYVPNWHGATILGILVSITDPVDVIIRLNQKRADHKFITLFELEALSNDATGIIFFNFFSKLAVDHNPAELSFNFFLMDLVVALFGGIAMGWLFRYLCVSWLKTIYNDNVNIINVMIVSSFILFVVVEYPLKMSGIFALITLGLGLSKSVNTTIDIKTISAIHGFYKYAMYLSETLIFIAVGLFIGHELSMHQEWINKEDFLKLFVFFICTILARFIAIGIFYYPLSKMGYGLNWKKYVLLSYGGLRGSHSLILALVLEGADFDE